MFRLSAQCARERGGRRELRQLRAESGVGTPVQCLGELSGVMGDVCRLE